MEIEIQSQRATLKSASNKYQIVVVEEVIINPSPELDIVPPFAV